MRPLRLPWHQRLLLAVTLGALTGLSCHFRLFWQPDESIYDNLVGQWDYPADPRLAIVAIDDRSLQQLGQWPWPRSTHAQLIDRLQDAGVRRIALDLMFPEPDRKDSRQDAQLAAAIARSGNVILPVLASAGSDEAVPEELLPVPQIASVAAALAHTDIEIDGDGVARGIYLKAGMDSPHWPALGVALAGSPPPLPGLRGPANGEASPYQWRRDNYVRVHYAGPPGSFPQVSYIDVLEGRVPASLLHDRLVIVGMTASGMAPRLLTPTSREAWMSGSEYQANVASMLLTDRAIVPLSPLQQMLASVALVLLTTLAVTAPTSRRWLIACLLLPLPLLSSLVLLRGFHVWYAPVCALSAGLVLLLAWGLWQARYWRRQANHDPLTGLANRMRFEGILRLETDAARRSGKPLTLMLIDVDHFKAYNDTHGHHLGDQMLRQVAQAIGDIARRPRDVAARFGGDEFALILPDTPQEGALALVQQLITTVRHVSLPIGKGRTAHTSVTVGIYSVVPGIHDTASALYQAADDALYTAKEAGRDGYHAATP